MVLPLGSPIEGLDGTQINEIPVPKGTRIFVNIVGCNVDPTIWGNDSHEWKPERWLQQLPGSVSSARIPGVYSNMLV
jgi:cytochrome P450